MRSDQGHGKESSVSSPVPGSYPIFRKQNLLYEWPRFRKRQWKELILPSVTFLALTDRLVCMGNATVESRLFVVDSRSFMNELVAKDRGFNAIGLGDCNISTSHYADEEE